ncbi:amino acid ABC transporter substrate-binding protein [Hyphobacterium sp. HN65]|uniref:Amino acid ABC transporter substrate-binding protein n=1 Tax=Hyphobacterium lacteum TaxID=3116575 RepID=A0ABU7LM28_9PROT|nr:amino acid ABC transporter substrate-binding protein [Hyphobacterium sp. HN65]MEE2524993.1 amino acid ABC transporter substrate-binding protein [Hyphobacterium sp. HN65]
MSPLSFLSPRRLREAAIVTLGGLAGVALDSGEVANSGSTLRAIETRGELICGVDGNLVGFSSQNDDGDWVGFDADLCRAYAAAILGDPDDVRFVPVTTVERFQMLADGEVDLLVRNTSWTFARDVGQDFDFAGIAYFDGQGFMVPADLGISSARDINGARVCVQASTTTALNLDDYIAANNLDVDVIEYDTALGGLEGYVGGECDVYTNDLSSLAGLRVSLDNPAEHILLPDVISKEPLGPVIRSGDSHFHDVAQWVLYTLIAAEEFGVTSDNVAALAQNSRNREVLRMLGGQDDFGSRLGLEVDFAVTMIAATGNYGDIFNRNLGSGSELGLRRGLNAQWTEGGLLYSPPFR